MNCYKNVFVDFYCKAGVGRHKSIVLRCAFIIPESKSFSVVACSGLDAPLFLQDVQGTFTAYTEPEEYGVYMPIAAFNDFVAELKKSGFEFPEIETPYND